MKSILLFIVSLWTAWAFGQEPAIEGDTMLCPQGEGTAYIVTDMAYDSYQWQVKAYGETDFEDIEGETSASFTYDAYTYTVTYIRVEVTLDGNTYHSNALFIDGMTFLPIYYMTETEGNVVQNADTWWICEGGSITNTVGMPYTVVQWYKDGVAIEGATSTSYTITQPGDYYAIAHPPGCPSSAQTTLTCVVDPHPDCNGSGNENPVIEGDIMLCPDTTGTAEVTNDIEYDSYQWYVKFDGDEDFIEVDGETGPTFSYDAYNYIMAEIKVVVTLGEEIFESNVLSIDGYAWGGIYIVSDTSGDNVEIQGDGTILLCEGTGFANEIAMPYEANIQWYRNGDPIDGATETIYTITTEGSYHVEGAPAYCPNAINSTAGTPIIVAMQDCTAGTGKHESDSFSLFPNPASNILTITFGSNTSPGNYNIYDIAGKMIISGNISTANNTINVSGLAEGTYIIKLTGENINASKLFIKQ